MGDLARGWKVSAMDYQNTERKNKVVLNSEDVKETFARLINWVLEDAYFEAYVKKDDLLREFDDKWSVDEDRCTFQGDLYDITITKVTVEFEWVPKVRCEGWTSFTKRA